MAAADDDNTERQRVLALLKRHGDNPTSFQILEPGYAYWFAADACVAYHDTGLAWVAAGAPVAPRDRLAEVAQQFVAAARRQGRAARFFSVDEAFAQGAGLQTTHIGEQPLWDPCEWEAMLKQARSLREQLRRARAKGVRARSVDPAEMADRSHPTRKACEALIERWLASRPMTEMQFMVLVHPFEHASERRYVVAEQDGRLVGFAAAVPVYARDGWFVEDVLRDPTAPNGTAEVLVDTVMRMLAAEQCRYVTLGLAPLAGEVNAVLRFTRNYTAALYNFGGVRSFKAKLRPARWEPVYLAYPEGEFGIRAMRDVLSAFAPGGLIRFGIHTLLHQRSLATAVLGVLLLPWTVGLVALPTERWFPSATVQWSWAAFDLLLVTLMLLLARRWRARLATVLIALTSADAVLTLMQVLWWNIYTASSALEWALIVVGVTGPLLASSFFWATRLVAVRSKLPLPARRGVKTQRPRSLDSLQSRS